MFTRKCTVYWKCEIKDGLWGCYLYYNSESRYLARLIPHLQLTWTASLNMLILKNSQSKFHHCLTWTSFPFVFPLLCVNWEHSGIYTVLSVRQACAHPGWVILYFTVAFPHYSLSLSAHNVLEFISCINTRYTVGLLLPKSTASGIYTKYIMYIQSKY